MFIVDTIEYVELVDNNFHASSDHLHFNSFVHHPSALPITSSFQSGRGFFFQVFSCRDNCRFPRLYFIKSSLFLVSIDNLISIELSHCSSTICCQRYMFLS